MNHPEHTPGPLAVTRHATPEHSPQFGIYREGDSSGRDIAIVTGPNAAPDAALFAASPELLETLKTIEIETTTDIAGISHDEALTLIATIRAMTRDAIEKATVQA